MTRWLATLALAAVVATAGAAPMAHAQAAFSSPSVHGIWNPVVGAGSVYEMRDRGGRAREMEIAVIGTDTVDGKPAYWLQITTQTGTPARAMTAESLLTNDGGQTEVKRLLVQQAGEPPYELPPTMRQRNRLSHLGDVRKQAERVGTEEVTTPAGTFACEHYRTPDGAVDVWVSDKVTPWGIVKMQGRNRMTLVRLVSGATRRITGTPTMLDPAKPKPPQTADPAPR